MYWKPPRHVGDEDLRNNNCQKVCRRDELLNTSELHEMLIGWCKNTMHEHNSCHITLMVTNWLMYWLYWIDEHEQVAQVWRVKAEHDCLWYQSEILDEKYLQNDCFALPSHFFHFTSEHHLGQFPYRFKYVLESHIIKMWNNNKQLYGIICCSIWINISVCFSKMQISYSFKWTGGLAIVHDLSPSCTVWDLYLFGNQPINKVGLLMLRPLGRYHKSSWGFMHSILL